MKKILALLLLLALCLTAGCSEQTGEYYTESAHSEKESVQPSAHTDTDINSYYTLRGTILNMVSMGVAEDVLRVGQYNGDLEADLKAVVQEVTTAEPIGIYGVASINIDQARVLTYQELSVSIQYKRTAEELRSVTEIRGTFDLQNRIHSLLQNREAYRVYALTDGTYQAERIQQEIYSAWMKCGADAPATDYVAADFYPEGSDETILELQPQYLDTEAEQQVRLNMIDFRAKEICAELQAQENIDPVLHVSSWLLENVEYDDSARRVVNETGGGQRKSNTYTAYGALVENKAAQSGFVLAASVLFDHLEIEHSVVTGTVGEDIYSWIVLTIDGEEYVLDVTAIQNGREEILYTTEAAAELFISW